MQYNNNIKVGVIAGTPVDTQMGVDFVRESGFEVQGFPTASSPKEQNHLQFLNSKLLTEKVINIIRKLEGQSIFRTMIYCNSLSSAIDVSHIRSCCPNTVLITPLDIYKDISADFKKIVLWAANGQSLASIEKIFYENNPSISIIGVSMLPVIESIERQENANDIFKKFDLLSLCLKDSKVEGLVLGCTHLPYLNSVFNNVDIPIIDPAEKMLQKLILTESEEIIDYI